MNLWECDEPGCNRAAVGTGGAVGLRAIGWYFRVGPTLFCPWHRPDKIPCVEDGENKGKPCGPCAAEAIVAPVQETLTTSSDRAEIEALRGQPLRIPIGSRKQGGA